jgi:hypothetical protein
MGMPLVIPAVAIVRADVDHTPEERIALLGECGLGFFKWDCSGVNEG